jgi:hypothetical protein
MAKQNPSFASSDCRELVVFAYHVDIPHIHIYAHMHPIL